MFPFQSKWKKASQYENVLKEVQYRLNLLKSEKCALSAYLRHEIVQSLCNGELSHALDRAQQLLRDESLISVYDSLIDLSDFILLNFSKVRKNGELLDVGVKETVSTLVFASYEFDVDFSELSTLRVVSEKRYGRTFVETAINLLPGNCVNTEVIKKLSTVSVSDFAKSKLLVEIVDQYGLGLEVLEFDYTPEKKIDMDGE